MAKMVLGVTLPPHSGEYDFDLPPDLTMAEERILKQMAGIVFGELPAELEKGSLSALLAVACISMQRAGVNVNPRAFDDRKAGHIEARFEDAAEDADAGPPLSAPPAEQNANSQHSGPDSSASSDASPEMTNLRAIGAPS